MSIYSGPGCKKFFHTPHNHDKVSMEELKCIVEDLRPYTFRYPNPIIKDVEDQLKAKLPNMTLADLDAFAKGVEGYIRKKYGVGDEWFDETYDWRGFGCFEDQRDLLLDGLDAHTIHLLLNEGFKPFKMVQDGERQERSPNVIVGGSFVFALDEGEDKKEEGKSKEKQGKKKRKVEQKEEEEEKGEVDENRMKLFKELLLIRMDDIKKEIGDAEGVDVEYVEVVKDFIRDFK